MVFRRGPVVIIVIRQAFYSSSCQLFQFLFLPVVFTCLMLFGPAQIAVIEA